MARQRLFLWHNYSMGKYWRFFQASFQISFSYRFAILIRMIRDFLMVLFFIVLWQALFKGKQLIGGFTFAGMVSYYILGKALDQLYTFDPANVMARHVRTGDLSNFLIKPVNYTGYLGSFIFGRRLARTFLTIIASIIIILAFPDFIGRPAGMIELAAFIIFAALAWILMFSVSFLIGGLSFWSTETENIRAGIEQLMLILGGLWIPLNLLPEGIGKILSPLPFKYLYYFPIRVFLGKVNTSDMITGLLTDLAWVVFFLFCGSVLWRKGLKRYGAYGG